MMNAEGVLEIISSIDQVSIDRSSIPQNQLDIVNRKRTSLFPWRGQFSPELIELLLSTYANKDSVIVDPFVGSGTALFEAARKSLTCFGAEINPAAVEMARTVHFTNIAPSQREKYVNRAKIIIKKYLSSSYRDSFSFQENKKNEINGQSLEDAFICMLNEAFKDEFVFNIVINTILRYSYLKNKEAGKVLETYNKQAKIVKELPYNKNLCKVFHCDARDMPLDDDSVDLIITSPPYINVFNYHQNYRGIMELAGWDILHIAKSEIGSNRKNRGNRFLTVIQYSIDMLQSLKEMRRIIHPEGRIIIIIGRESKVRGVSFENYKILATLAVGGAGLRMICRQERKFINRFGKIIYEDLLHFIPNDTPQVSNNFSKKVAHYFLKEAKSKSTDRTYQDIVSAIKSVNDVTESP